MSDFKVVNSHFIHKVALKFQLRQLKDALSPFHGGIIKKISYVSISEFNHTSKTDAPETRVYKLHVAYNDFHSNILVYVSVKFQYKTK